ncbi:MAG: hypothetical protein ACLSV8_04545 [Clostridia bacterium]|nr:MAG TPA: hypothetical protein [Caudoviricetes sp.]
MQEINFEDGKTSLSGATFNAFQNNIKNAFHNYKTGEIAINSDVVKDGSIYDVVLTKDESGIVTFALRWESTFDLNAGWDYKIGYLPQEFRPQAVHLSGGCRGEQPTNPATYVLVGAEGGADDGRIIVSPSQKCRWIMLCATYKALGGIEE